MAYDNNNQGALFKNTKKTKPTQPEYRGPATINNLEYNVSGWIKEAGPDSQMAGQKFMSLAFTPAEDPGGVAPAQPEVDADIPF